MLEAKILPLFLHVDHLKMQGKFKKNIHIVTWWFLTLFGSNLTHGNWIFLKESVLHLHCGLCLLDTAILPVFLCRGNF